MERVVPREQMELPFAHNTDKEIHEKGLTIYFNKNCRATFDGLQFMIQQRKIVRVEGTKKARWYRRTYCPDLASTVRWMAIQNVNSIRGDFHALDAMELLEKSLREINKMCSKALAQSR